MRILVTNDDGYEATGLVSLVKVLRKFGDLTIVAPKSHQSGMSMAVSMGLKPIAVKHLPGSEHEDWWYLDGTPASCVKFGIDNVMADSKPDLVVSGINHGNNIATATLYSGTVGSAMEGAVNRIPSIAVSMDDPSIDADFSPVEELLPEVLEKLIPIMNPRYGVYYNINFPAIPASEIKGVRISRMGRGHWEKEYRLYSLEFFEKLGIPETQFHRDAVANAEPGETVYVMAGDFTDEEDNVPEANHRLMNEGYIVITPQTIECTDEAEFDRLKKIYAE